MRLKPLMIPLFAFALAGVTAWAGARVIAGIVEERSVLAVREALLDDNLDWAQVLGDGLQIVIEGEAPTEAIRFRAISAAGTAVDPSRIIDNMRVTEGPGLNAPDFAIEILRNDSGVSLVGLIPAATDRDRLARQIAQAAAGQEVTDLLETADYPVPEDWGMAMDYALSALAQLPRSKISVEAGSVALTAIASSREERQQLEADLGRMAPLGLDLAMEINAPRPVITPFALRFVIDDTGARFDACAADTEEARARILTAAVAAGAPESATCTLALGVPSATWGEAAEQAITALSRLGGGTLTFADADVALVAAPGTDQDLFDEVVGELENTLPDVFALAATLPPLPDAAPDGPPEFSVALTEDGATLRGRVNDALMNTTAESFAKAAFGAGRVTMGTRVAPDGLPPGWSVRVLAGIEALSLLNTGNLRVQPDSIILSGRTGRPDAQEEISRLFIARLGEATEFSLDITYDESLDPIAALPSPEECVAAITALTAERKITFDPGSATISGAGMAVLDGVAEILRACAELRLLIAGYTDSQGRDETNLALSQDRAEAVLAALRARRVPVAGFQAVGYGEADPIADNATADGREANRRIEFRLLDAAGEVVTEAGEAAEAETDAEAPEDGPERAEPPETRPAIRPEGLAEGAEAGQED